MDATLVVVEDKASGITSPANISRARFQSGARLDESRAIKIYWSNPLISPTNSCTGLAYRLDGISHSRLRPYFKRADVIDTEHEVHILRGVKIEILRCCPHGDLLVMNSRNRDCLRSAFVDLPVARLAWNIEACREISRPDE